jgi:hypothetical protein
LLQIGTVGIFVFAIWPPKLLYTLFFLISAAEQSSIVLIVISKAPIIAKYFEFLFYFCTKGIWQDF